MTVMVCPLCPATLSLINITRVHNTTATPQTVIEMAITRLDNRATAVTGAAPDPIDNLTGIALSDRVKDMHPVDAERLSPEWNEVQGGPGADAQGRGAGGGGASGGGGRGASGGASGGGSGGGGSGGAQELARAASPDVGMEWDGSMQDLQGEEVRGGMGETGLVEAIRDCEGTVCAIQEAIQHRNWSPVIDNSALVSHNSRASIPTP